MRCSLDFWQNKWGMLILIHIASYKHILCIFFCHKQNKNHGVSTTPLINNFDESPLRHLHPCRCIFVKRCVNRLYIGNLRLQKNVRKISRVVTTTPRCVSRRSPTVRPSESLVLAPWAKLKNAALTPQPCQFDALEVFFPEASVCAWMAAKGPRIKKKRGAQI